MREPWFLRKRLRPYRWVNGIVLILVICAFITPALAETPAPAAPGAAAATGDQQMLEKVVNKALEHQLAPVKEMLTELTIHQTSLPDILGGIGYIMGFFGLWAYFQSKKRKDS